MLFCTGPVFQASAGLAEIEVRQGVRRVLLETDFKGCTRLLVFVLAQKIVACGKFLGAIIIECLRHGWISIEPKQRDEKQDLFHRPPYLVYCSIASFRKTVA
jgi:hypothetical protein